MANRLQLDKKLRELVGKNVYFQPPESKKIEYPCIIYGLSNINTRKADNKLYNKFDRYTVTLIHRDPDNILKDRILEELQPYCSFDRLYTKDNLYHYVYDLYH